MSDFLIMIKFAIVNAIFDPDVRLRNAKICIDIVTGAVSQTSYKNMYKIIPILCNILWNYLYYLKQDWIKAINRANGSLMHSKTKMYSQRR